MILTPRRVAPPLPGVDGYEATRRLRQIPELQPTVIIASSASITDVERQNSLVAGCDAFLPKPLEAGALFDALERLLRLTWIRREGEDPNIASDPEGDVDIGSLTPPPAREIALLLDLARRGRVRNLLHELDRLEGQDPQIKPWVRHMRTLARGFDVSKLCEQLERQAGGTV